MGHLRGGEVRGPPRFPRLPLLPAVGRPPDSGKIPTLAVERKILRRSYHTLRELGDAALAPPVPEAKGVVA